MEQVCPACGGTNFTAEESEYDCCKIFERCYCECGNTFYCVYSYDETQNGDGEVISHQCDQCPACGEEDDIEWGVFEPDAELYWIPAECRKCGLEFKERYKFSRSEPWD